MKIKFRRSGGFANIPVEVEIDTENMEQTLSGQLQSLVEKVLPLHQEQVDPMPDMHSYELTLDIEGQEQSLNTNDAHLTDDLANLFDFLLQQ